jgi:putative ABC transport system ATP-binding protein
MNTVIQAEALSKQIEGPDEILPILGDIHLQVAAGEAVAILGASGSGKSTLLGLLAGLDLPSGGRIRLFDTPLHELDEDSRARLRLGRVGFVFQSFQLLPGLSALENVMLPAELAGRRLARAEAGQILRQVGLDARLHHLPHQLSGGEQQRVAIARAFAADPQILFADEPTGNLDQATGQRIIELLFELRASRGTALVLVTHDPALAARCDRQYRLSGGRIAA